MFQPYVYSAVAAVVLSLVGAHSPALAQKMRVTDLHIPEAATDASHMKRRGDVRFKMPSDFKTFGTYYAKILTQQQWRKSARDNLQRNFWVQTFAKETATLVVRVSREKTGCAVRLTPTGLMWEEDDQPTPKDLPLPKDATNVEYSDFFERINFKSPSDVRTIAEFLSTELEKRRWTKARTTFDFDHLIGMEYTFDKSTIDFMVRAEDDGSDVTIDTEGMQWDGMKEEIERAKQEAERVAVQREEAAALEQERSFNVASLPKRKDKPKQGIAKLPKLPTEATVVVDDEAYKLTNFIAYEVYDDNEWVTKVVATQNAVKQASLLAKLKKSGTDLDENESPPSWPEPYLVVVIDEDDRLEWLNLRAGGTPGSAFHDELTGTALVEEGRARGQVRLTEPGDFFDKVYTADISFDLPILTADSVPEKRLANAPKLESTGQLTIGSNTYTLANAVAYEMKFFGDPMTTIVLSQRPFNMSKLKAALGKQAIDHYSEFTPHVKLLVDADDNVSSVSIWADNISVGGNQNLQSDIVIEDGRARGTARMTEPGRIFDDEYSFNLSFDVDVLRKSGSPVKRPAGILAADSFDGLPVPAGYDGIQSSGSPFRKESTTTITADLENVVAFYRFEMASGEWGQWKENASSAKVAAQSAELSFTGPSGSLIVKLSSARGPVAITTVVRDAQAAKAAGLLPTPGKARLFIGNESAQPVAFTINKSDYNIRAGAGARSPKTGFNWEVAPGNYTVQVKSGQSEKLTISADETWGVIFGPSGFVADRLY